MKALIIIASCIALALVLKIVDLLTSRKAIKSVGAKSNGFSKDIARIDITNPEDIKAAVEYYKGLPD